MKTDHNRATARIQSTPGTRPKAELLPCSSSRLLIICNKSAGLLMCLVCFPGELSAWFAVLAFVLPGLLQAAGAPAPATTEQPEQRSLDR